MEPLYGEDLAHIHAEGFGDHARGAAPALLDYLRAAGLDGGRVVDLGCGAGDWLAALGRAGFEAVGWEPSPALARRARATAPDARVHVGGVEDADLDGAVAVTALGEVFNYRTPRRFTPTFAARFRRIAEALPPGGLLLFDVIVGGGRSLDGRGWVAGEDWFVASEFVDRGARGERRIVTFRRDGAAWRRGEEIHHVHLPTRRAVLDALRGNGFTVRTARRWGEMPLLPRRHAFIARRR